MPSRWIPIPPLLLGAAAPALAQLPTTIAPDLYAFPGGHTSPGSAVSAGLALADRFLGDEPFANPAAARASTLSLSPALLRVSRQDLRADNRSYDEQPAFFNAAGGWFGWARGPVGATLYGYQPLVRLEDNAFNRGTQLGPPLIVQSNTSARELRAGVALSLALGRARLGVAPEWTFRSDHYERLDTGGPAPESRVADFSGGGVGGQIGFRLAIGSDGAGGFTLGGAARWVPELTLEGDERLDLVAGSSANRISTRRDAGWEGGIGLAYAATAAFQVIASAGGRSEQKYDRFAVRRGEGGEWKLAGEFHDRRDPWTARFGIGAEHESGVAEPRAGVVGFGFGWIMESTTLEVGVIRRSFERSGHPRSADERVLFGIVQKL